MKALALISGLFASLAFAGSPVIFDSGRTRTLTDNVSLNNKIYWIQGTADPTITPQTAAAGSYYMKTSATVGLYIKTDAGSSTNWTLIGGAGGSVSGPASSTDKALVRWNGAGGVQIQNSSATLSDAGLLSTANVTVTTFGTGVVHSSVAGVLSSSAVDLSSADASGVLAAGRFPALTGDITTSAGALGTTLASSISGAKTFSTSLTSPAFISSTANAASAGQQRLASTDTIKWRNNANGADVSLAKDTSDQLSWAGTSFLSNAGILLAAGFPALSGDITTSAGSLTTTYNGVVPIAKGGTNGGTAAAGFNNLSPMTALGDLIYGGASGGGTRLAGDTSNANRFLREVSSGGVAAAPSWQALVAGDIPSLAASIITSGTLATSQGGTNLNTSASTGVPSISSGTWSVAATLANSKGGTGGDSSAQTGIAHVASGAWSYAAVGLASSDVTGTLPVGNGGTGIANPTAHDLLIGNGSSAMNVLAPGSAGNVIASNGTDPVSVTLSAGYRMQNCGLKAAISASTLVLNLTQSDGSTDPTAASPCIINFRSATAGNGDTQSISFTAATALTLGTAASSGNPSGANSSYFIYAIQDTTSELCVANTDSLDTAVLTSATATPSTAAGTLYCTNTHTSRPIRLIGRVTDTWSNPNHSAISNLSPWPFGDRCATTGSTFTWNGSGSTTASLSLVTCRHGDWVTLFIPTCQATSGTSSTVLTANTAIPTWAWPLGTTNALPVNAVRNSGGDTHAGLIQITTTGIIQFFRDNASTAFSNSVNAGISAPSTYTYYVGNGS